MTRDQRNEWDEIEGKKKPNKQKWKKDMLKGSKEYDKKNGGN